MSSSATDSILRFRVAAAGERLDKFLASRAGLSRSQIQLLIAQGVVSVNGASARKAALRLEAGDEVQARPAPAVTVALEPQAIPVRVVYQDQELLVVDKPAGLTVHPAPGHPDKTLVNAILALCPELQSQAGLPTGQAGSLRPGIVHRLDKDTSGLMVVAKRAAAHDHLARQFQERTLSKHYLALVKGHLSPEQGAIEAPIGRDPRQRQRMAVVERGRPARTSYQVLEYLGNYTLLKVTPETGRTHQIRVHLAAIGHPVVGDAVYGHRVDWCPRQFLHAHLLGFRRPSDGAYVEFQSELPEDLAHALALVRG